MRRGIPSGMNQRLRDLKTYPMVRLDRLKDAATARGLTIHDFGTGDPREPTPDFIREACQAGLAAVSQYPKVTGLPAMRRAAAGYVERRFGVTIDPEQAEECAVTWVRVQSRRVQVCKRLFQSTRPAVHHLATLLEISLQTGFGESGIQQSQAGARGASNRAADRAFEL